MIARNFVKKPGSGGLYGNQDSWYARLPKFLFPYGKALHVTYLKGLKYDKRTSYFSSGIPLFVILTACVTVTTLVMDKQFELRDYRVRSLGTRELSLQEENKQMMKFLGQTTPDDDYDNQVPLPNRPKEPRL